jgi:hypothetical protein
MSKKEKVIEAYCELYNASAVLFIGSKKKFNKFAQKEFGFKVAGKDGADGCMSHLASEDGDEVFLIWLNKFDGGADGIGLLSHECVHAALELMDDRGLPISLENEECIAYLSQFFLWKFLKELL